MPIWMRDGNILRHPSGGIMGGETCCCEGCPCGLEGLDIFGAIDGGSCACYVGYSAVWPWNGSDSVSDVDASNNPVTITGTWSHSVGVSCGSSWVIKLWCNPHLNKFRAQLWCDGVPSHDPVDVTVTSCDPDVFDAEVTIPVDDGTACACGAGAQDTHITFTR